MVDLIKEITCSWKNCGKVISVEKERRALSQHLASHLPDIEIVCDEDGEELYECSWSSCQFNCRSAVEITIHVKYHAYLARLKALGAYYAEKKDLPACAFPKPEEEQIPPGCENYRCKWKNCDESFNCFESFILHTKVHHIYCANPNSEKRYICLWKDCETDTNQKNRMFDHIKAHTGERSMACPTCGHMFASITKFSNHCYRQLPVEEHRFKCRHCLNRYPTVRLLQDHMRLHVHHYKCTFCDLTCRAPAILAKHIRYRHLSVKPFKCNMCTYKCKTQYDLKVHHTTHTGEKYLCDVDDCDFTTTKEFNLTRHIEKVHGSRDPQSYRCHLCERKFTRGYGLTKHLSSAHNVQKPNGFSRFQYRRDEDGYWKLQTTRLESVMVTEDDSCFTDSDDSDRIDDPQASTIEIQVMNESAGILETEENMNSNQDGNVKSNENIPGRSLSPITSLIAST